MPRNSDPKQCACGCGDETRGGDYLPGHDQRLRAAIEQSVGGLLALKRLVEDTLGQPIEVNNNAKEMGDKVIAEVGRYSALTVKENEGFRYPVQRKDWRTGSLWLAPLTSTKEYRLKLTGDALTKIQWKVALEFGKPVQEDQGYPVWHIKEKDMPRAIAITGDA